MAKKKITTVELPDEVDQNLEEKQEKKSNGEVDFDKLAKLVGGEILDRMDTVKTWVDTGNLALNFGCSGKFMFGGIPIGKLIEIWGNSSSCKTLFALSFLRGLQRLNGICVFIDVENTINATFAERAAHVNTKNIIVIPVQKVDSLEKAFNQIHTVIREIVKGYGTSRPILIVYDSIAASASEKEFAETKIDMFKTSKEAKKEAGAGSSLGEHAKVIGKELRKLNPVLNGNNAAVVFINQVREKIGVLFGCFSGASKVLLSDGTWMRISKIVRNRLSVEVMSYNQITGMVEPKKIIDWHNNGRSKDGEFIKIKFRRHFSKGYGYLMVTRNHLIFTSNLDGSVKEVEAGSLEKGDIINVVQPFYLNEDQWQLIYGSILGDGSLRYTANDGRNVQLRFGHCIEQTNYLLYKNSFLGNLSGKVGTDSGLKVYADSKPLYELNRLISYKCNYIIPDEICDNINELGLAIWYLDDGSYGGYHEKWGAGKCNICCKKFKNKEIMLKAFKKFDIYPTVKDVGFIFDAENTLKLHQLIARFVPPVMDYKLHPKFRGLFDYVPQTDHPIIYKSVPSVVLDVKDYLHKANRWKYDLTIEDNSTYVVGGAIVHNSPEKKASGGRSLEYYCSLSMKTKASKKLKDDRENVKGILVSVENTKNKCFRPFVEAPENAKLLFDAGIDPVGGLLACLYKQYRIDKEKAGYWKIRPEYTNGEEVIFQASLEKNVVPVEILVKYPKLIDAETSQQVSDYLDSFTNSNAINADYQEQEIKSGEDLDMELIG